MKSYSIIWGLLLGISIATLFVSEMVSPEVYAKLLKEGGWIETASWVSYLIAAVFLLIQTIKWPARWSMLVFTLLFAMRELDCHKRFTTMGIFTNHFYLSDLVPFTEKLLVGVFIAAMLTALFFLVKNHLRPFIRKVRNGEGASLTVLFSLGLLAFTKSIDGLSRKLQPFGIEISDRTNRVVTSVEEILELMAAVLLIVASVAVLRQRSK